MNILSLNAKEPTVFINSKEISTESLSGLTFVDIVNQVYVENENPSEHKRVYSTLRDKIRSFQDLDLLKQRIMSSVRPLLTEAIEAIDEEIHERICKNRSWNSYLKLDVNQQKFVFSMLNPQIMQHPKWDSDIKEKIQRLSKEDLYVLRIANFWEPLNTKHDYAKNLIAKRHDELNTADFDQIRSLNLNQLLALGWAFPDKSFMRVYKGAVDKHIKNLDLISLLDLVQNLDKEGKLTRKRTQGICLREVLFKKIVELITEEVKFKMLGQIFSLKFNSPIHYKNDLEMYSQKTGADKIQFLINKLVQLDDIHIGPVFSQLRLAKL